MDPVDVCVAVVAWGVGGPVVLVVGTVRGLARRLATLAGPVVDVVVLHPPLVPSRGQPAHLLVVLSRQGRHERQEWRRRTGRLLDVVVPRITGEVLGRVDLTGIARTVVTELDLPAIIRDSTGAVTSEAVHDVRLRGISADESVERAVDRLLRRRRPQPTS